MSLLRHGNPVLPARRCGGGARQFGGGFHARRTNLVANGGFETAATGWGDGGNTTLSRSTEQARSGSASGKSVMDATNAGENACAFTAITFAAAGIYTFSVNVYIPTAWSGGTVALDHSGYAGSSPADGGNVNADMGVRDAWQRIVSTVAISAGDLAGQLRVVATGIESGESIYVDDVQVEAGATATPYIATDGATKTRVATRHG